MSIERTWEFMVLDLQRRGQHDTFSWINAGSRIVQAYYDEDSDEYIRFVQCITPEPVNRS